jgi:hypothetical protein
MAYGLSQDFLAATNLANVEAALRSLGQPKPPPNTGTERDVAAFKARLDDMAKWVQQQAADLQKRIVGEAFYRLVQATPVDTGRARSGWRITVNGLASDAVAAAMQGLKPGDRVGLTNPVVYMERLAQGYSKQAPAGWIDRALADVRAKFARVG